MSQRTQMLPRVCGHILSRRNSHEASGGSVHPIAEGGKAFRFFVLGAGGAPRPRASGRQLPVRLLLPCEHRSRSPTQARGGHTGLDGPGADFARAGWGQEPEWLLGLGSGMDLQEQRQLLSQLSWTRRSHNARSCAATIRKEVRYSERRQPHAGRFPRERSKAGPADCNDNTGPVRPLAGSARAYRCQDGSSRPASRPGRLLVSRGTRTYGQFRASRFARRLRQTLHENVHRRIGALL
jgi:hypothetical protein